MNVNEVLIVASQVEEEAASLWDLANKHRHYFTEGNWEDVYVTLNNIKDLVDATLRHLEED